MAKNVVVTVDDYLMKKDPEKYKGILKVKAKAEKETVKEAIKTNIEIQKLRDENKELKAEIKKLKKEK